MSKELTLLEAFEDLTNNFPKNYSESYQIILKALKRLEMYDNIVGIEKINDSNKKLKTLNLIKEKGVNVGDFIDTFIIEELSYQHYLDYHDNYSYKLLDKEEFCLLKEVLK